MPLYQETELNYNFVVLHVSELHDENVLKIQKTVAFIDLLLRTARSDVSAEREAMHCNSTLTMPRKLLADAFESRAQFFR